MNVAGTMNCVATRDADRHAKDPGHCENDRRMKIYEVGGAVRDRLLQRPVQDRDWVVVGATAEEMLALGYRQVGKDFPVFLHPKTQEEYALARTERKTAKGYTGFTVNSATGVTLEEDLARRDLTINAMALDADGTLIDPYHGARDLALGVLRHVTPAFVEDPLRVLRVARFAARFNFTVAPETLALMRELATSGELETLAPERIWTELERALGEPHPERCVEVLRECAALATLLPEVDRLFGVPQRADHHPEIDTGVHLLLCLQQAAAKHAGTRVRFAVLVHDLGKGTTSVDVLPRHIGHEERSVALAQELCERLRVPNDYRALGLLVARYHTTIHRALELRPKTVLELLESTDALRRPERFAEVLLACEVDAQGRTGKQTESYPQRERLLAALAVIQTVDPRALVAEGHSGEALKNRIRQARLEALTAWLEAQEQI